MKRKNAKPAPAHPPLSATLAGVTVRVTALSGGRYRVVVGVPAGSEVLRLEHREGRAA